MHRIAVIIPVKNDPRIVPALDKLISIGGFRDGLSIVVVDNGSSDRNYNEMQNYCRTQPQVVLLRELGAGSYVARNSGIRYALNELDAEVLAFIDSDCIVSDDWLSAISNTFENDAVAAVTGKSFGINKNPIALYEQMLYDRIVADFLNESALKRVDTRNFAVRSNVLKKTGLFLPVRYGGDMEFGARIHKLGMLSIYSSEMILYHENPCHLGDLLIKRVRQNHGNHQLHDYCETSYLETYLPHLFKYRPVGFIQKFVLFIHYLVLIFNRYTEFRFAHLLCLTISKLSPRIGFLYFKVMVSRACRLGDISYFLGLPSQQV
ncbi:glycosyltransferase [Kineobactrum salinum]|uniref:Glycosyltransferase family 2 protein n=1 Tax=Kineobactrum salinum TaxID=2708301 RepID=A0A6C0U201_9GAMM|nr:glycosyltransferase family 2 protein [Kineobactrum salinum]QIB66160.1 glycosyltransferase family 2 protein [Kineobactrum salinum]